MHIQHLISMMLGSSECIHVVNDKMVIGRWQSVLMVDLDMDQGYELWMYSVWDIMSRNKIGGERRKTCC